VATRKRKVVQNVHTTPLKKKSVKERKAIINKRLADAPGRQKNIARAKGIRSGQISTGKPRDPIASVRSFEERRFKSQRENLRETGSRPVTIGNIQGTPPRFKEAALDPQAEQPQQPTPTLPAPNETEEETFLRQQADDFARNETLERQTETIPFFKTGFTDDGVDFVPEETPLSVKVAGIGALAVAASAGVVAPIMNRLGIVGTNFLKTSGLNSKNVINSARGQNPLGPFANELPGRVKASANTSVTKKTLSYISKLTGHKQFTLAVQGFVSNVIFNGFLEEEAVQNLGIEASKLDEQEMFKEADEIDNIIDEITDLDMWRALGWAVPGKGVFTFMKSAQKTLKTRQKRREQKRTGQDPQSKRREEQIERDAGFERRTEEQREREERNIKNRDNALNRRGSGEIFR
jgi:hypothetical protein|tara:strand:+ start:191 stop:1411 length:1221 start_codon:yes stop_codon:yes gene_type:complete